MTPQKAFNTTLLITSPIAPQKDTSPLVDKNKKKKGGGENSNSKHTKQNTS